MLHPLRLSDKISLIPQHQVRFVMGFLSEPLGAKLLSQPEKSRILYFAPTTDPGVICGKSPEWKSNFTQGFAYVCVAVDTESRRIVSVCLAGQSPRDKKTPVGLQYMHRQTCKFCFKSPLIFFFMINAL